MDQQFLSFVLKVTSAESLQELEIIQSLWSGYGKIARYELKGGNVGSVIVKHIQLANENTHPRGWNGSISHNRKVKSYEVETKWYEQYANLCGSQCRIPKCYGITEQDGEVIIVLEDLDAAGYPGRKDQVNLNEIKNCLTWLANFHATFLGTAPAHLWSIGTYWHLDTRPEELDVLEDLRLRNAASSIDQKLNNCNYQTLVHGDAKLANFCFSSDGTEVAAVDFQYVGGGCGMKDVAYFLGSCMNEQECETYEQELLNHYFNQLKSTLDESVDYDELETEWRNLFPVAWTDFHRFLKGWSPGHWKLNSYSEKLAKQVLDGLDRSVLYDQQLISLAKVATTAAKQAGKYIQQQRNEKLEVLNKTAGSSEASQVLTQVDLESQKIILTHLIPTCDQHNFGILAEEEMKDRQYLNSRFSKNYFWCVDPLDGTLPFIEGKPGFSVSIAFVSKEGKAVIGVVYDPVSDNLYQAILGQGCIKNGDAWSLPSSSNSSEFLFSSNRSFQKLRSYEVLKNKLKPIASSENCNRVNEQNGAGSVMNAIWTLENHPGCYVALPKKEDGGGSIWDYAATACIYEELGIPAINCQGNTLRLNDKNSTFMNEQGVIYATSEKIKAKVLKQVQPLLLNS